MTKRDKAYEIYCQWCRDHGRNPPTRTWWNEHNRLVIDFTPDPTLDFDIETERREGWTYQ